MKYRARCEWAVGVIHKYYLGWKVRKEYRRKFRAIAGPKIVKFLRKCIVSNSRSLKHSNITKKQRLMYRINSGLGLKGVPRDGDFHLILV